MMAFSKLLILALLNTSIIQVLKCCDLVSAHHFIWRLKFFRENHMALNAIFGVSALFFMKCSIMMCLGKRGMNVNYYIIFLPVLSKSRNLLRVLVNFQKNSWKRHLLLKKRTELAGKNSLKCLRDRKKRIRFKFRA